MNIVYEFMSSKFGVFFPQIAWTEISLYYKFHSNTHMTVAFTEGTSNHRQPYSNHTVNENDAHHGFKLGQNHLNIGCQLNLMKTKAC